MGLIGKAGIDVQVQAHATLARCYAHLKGDQGAQAEYATVRSLWRDQAAAQKKLNDAYPDESNEARIRRLGKALDAVGEALFDDADRQKRTDVDTIRFPITRGRARRTTSSSSSRRRSATG